MTRKRFKKLLKAHGYQSREAEYAAWHALSEYGEYRLAWKNKWYALAVMRQCGVRMAQAGVKIRNAIQDWVENVLRPTVDVLQRLEPALDALKELIGEGIPHE